MKLISLLARLVHKSSNSDCTDEFEEDQEIWNEFPNIPRLQWRPALKKRLHDQRIKMNYAFIANSDDLDPAFQYDEQVLDMLSSKELSAYTGWVQQHRNRAHQTLLDDLPRPTTA